MFAYCMNNPVNNVDSAGMRPVNVNLANHLGEYGGSKTVPVGTSITGEDIIGVMKDIGEAFGRFIDFVTNDDEMRALENGPISFYRYRLVVHLPWDIDPFSFGAIFVGRDAKNWDIAVETMQHEYGHCVHMSQIGVIPYFVTVAIPSLIGHANVEYDEYYSQPWEYIPEILGGVTTRPGNNGQPYPYSSDASRNAFLYWIFTFLIL